MSKILKDILKDKLYIVKNFKSVQNISQMNNKVIIKNKRLFLDSEISSKKKNFLELKEINDSV